MSATPLASGARVPIDVPASGALYEGHFPGRPILPGIGVLALALRALRAVGAPPALREIATLRLRRLVAPGEDLELEVDAFDRSGRIRFGVRRGAEVVASAVLTLGGPPFEPLPPASAAPPARDVPPADLEALLPHRPPMRFVAGIVAERENGVSAVGTVPAASAFVERGRAPALVALELAAQSAAAFEALRRRGEAGRSGPRIGYLVGARDVRFARGDVGAGEPLTAVISLSGLAPPLSTYAFDVAGNEGPVAAGTVSTWLTATDA